MKGDEDDEEGENEGEGRGEEMTSPTPYSSHEQRQRTPNKTPSKVAPAHPLLALRARMPAGAKRRAAGHPAGGGAAAAKQPRRSRGGAGTYLWRGRAGRLHYCTRVIRQWIRTDQSACRCV